jgi:tetratricopeptide (TPR) repeat protein
VLEEARVRNLVNPSTVWLMVSAEKSVESVMGAAEHQPDAYLIKPITEGVLLTRLNRVWHKKQVFRMIDQAYAEKDYLRAARLCDARIEQRQDPRARPAAHEGEADGKERPAGEGARSLRAVLEQREYQWARAGLAKIRMANGEFEQARQIFQSVIAENRYYIDAYDQLAGPTRTWASSRKPARSWSARQNVAELGAAPAQPGPIALKLGNMAQMAEKAFRKCIAIGEYSIMKTPDAYLGLARVCGQKNDAKEALQLLLTAQREFAGEHPDIQLRTKITEGLVYHESGDYRRARKAGDELEEMLKLTPERPDTATCLELATLLFAVGVKDAPVELLCYVIRNNHDNPLLLDEVQAIFDKARMGEEGLALIRSSKKEASDLMNQGVLLWKTGKLARGGGVDAQCAPGVPNNQRILFNAAQIMVSHLQQHGYDAAFIRRSLRGAAPCRPAAAGPAALCAADGAAGAAAAGGRGGSCRVGWVRGRVYLRLVSLRLACARLGRCRCRCRWPRHRARRPVVLRRRRRLGLRLRPWPRHPPASSPLPLPA